MRDRSQVQIANNPRVPFPLKAKGDVVKIGETEDRAIERRTDQHIQPADIVFPAIDQGVTTKADNRIQPLKSGLRL